MESFQQKYRDEGLVLNAIHNTNPAERASMKYENDSGRRSVPLGSTEPQ